jgi:dissimilatory sulfite reductase (desulfoviridin) alpha/beta subunit
MATVRVWIVILTVPITLSVCPFNCMAHTANTDYGVQGLELQHRYNCRI